MATDSETNSSNAKVETSPDRSVMECAWNAAVRAFVVVLLGKMALSIVGGVISEMIPSALPGFEGRSSAETAPHTWWNDLVMMRYKVFFTVVFLVCLREQLATRSPAIHSAKSYARWQRIGHRFSENWFGSLIGNAFLAFALATVFAHLPSFSLWKLFWHWFLGWLQPGRLFGDGAAPWFDWYDQNQLRFNFWLIYIAAVCDDVGIPNFKSLGRWLWSRWTKPKVVLANDPAPANESGKM